MRVTDTLIKELRSALPGLELHENEPMAAHCSFRIGGPARLMVCPASGAQAAALLRFLRERGAPGLVHLPPAHLGRAPARLL